MATNKIPESYDALMELMEDAADGAATHGVTINLKQNDEVAIRAEIEALAGTIGTPGLKALLNTAKTTKSAKTAALRTVCSNSRTLAMTCIGSLKPRLGNNWNANWNAAGFTGGSLAVPNNPMVPLQQLRAYYIANPTHEVANVNGIACTAVACETAAQAISTAQSDSNQSNTDAGIAQANFEAGMASARRRMTGLREELTQLLDDTDERWYAFGFDRPVDPSQPEIPENLTVTPGAAGTLILHCDTSRRADGYRFRITNAAGGAELATKLSSEPEAVIEALPTGTNVNVTVTGRNISGGESQPSEPVAATVP